MDLLNINITYNNRYIIFETEEEFAINDVVVLEAEDLKCYFKVSEIDRDFVDNKAIIFYTASKSKGNFNKISFSTLNNAENLTLRAATNDESAEVLQWGFI